MNNESLAFLFKLLETASPSGFEVEAAQLWRAEAEAFAEEVSADSNGNSYARLKGQGPRVVIEGHIDEIGLMINHIDELGYCWFQPIGHWDDAVLVGQRVRVLGRNGPVTGAIGRIASHLLAPDAPERAIKLSSLWIDIGAASAAAARERVAVGDPAVIDVPPMRLGSDLLVARGLDNHAGAWAALEALRMLARGPRPAADVWAVASVQEEIGLWGSITAAHQLAPAVALAIDVWHASDYPDADQRRLGATRLGGGPAISRGATVHPQVVEQLIAAAEADALPYSTRSAVHGDTVVALSHVRD
jgi:endoglucanase